MKNKAKFSKITNGVYPLNVYKTFPDDALLIPDELYKSFCDGMINGFNIENGKVVAIKDGNEILTN